MEKKRAFKVREGYVHLHADKSKIEVRMLGYYTQDQVLLDILNDPTKDVHSEISFRMFKYFLLFTLSDTPP